MSRYFDEKANQWRWKSENIEVQKQVIRSIDAFLDFVSAEARAVHHTFVKVVGCCIFLVQQFGLTSKKLTLSYKSSLYILIVLLLPY